MKYISTTSNNNLLKFAVTLTISNLQVEIYKMKLLLLLFFVWTHFLITAIAKQKCNRLLPSFQQTLALVIALDHKIWKYYCVGSTYCSEA